MGKVKLVIIQKIFSDYRKGIFDRLHRKYDFLLIHGKIKNGINQIQTHYSRKVKTIKYGPKDTQVYLHIFPLIRKFRPDIVIHEFTPSILSLHTSFLLSRIMGFKFVIWGHGYNRKKKFVPRKRIKDKIRLYYLKKSDAVIVYGKKDREKLSQFIPAKKIFVAVNTLDTDKLISIRKELEKVGKRNIKRDLNINYRYNLVFIGRLLEDKHPDHLIAAVKKLHDNGIIDLALHFIGDGEFMESLNYMVQKENLSNIYFYGSIYDELLIGKYLYMADLMVMPGYVGLSVIHSFCYNLPVITYATGSRGPFHSPEIDYIINNETGYQLKSHNISHLADTIANFLNDKNKMEEMKNIIGKRVSEEWSLDKMVQGFDKCITYVNNEKV